MKINVHFFVLLMITLVVIISDILISFLKIDYLFSIIIGFLIVFSVCLYLIRKTKIVLSHDFEKADLLFFIIILAKLIVCINRPEGHYDVTMYHIYNQEYPFIDKVYFDFFPGRTINTFLYPLGDRIFYLSRVLLGYRLGTILSYYAAIIIFYQVKKLAYCIIGKEKDIRVPLLSNAIFFIYIMYVFIGSYQIDILSTIFILEIINVVFNNNNFFDNKYRLYLICLLTGISVGIKLPNLIIIAFVALYVLIKNYKGMKKLKFVDYVICTGLFLIPFFIYAYDNIIQTGSPMFPYYNKIFKSKWFDYINWEDDRYGIPNILFAFVWPFMVIINPAKTYDLEIYDFVWTIGYIATVVYIIYRLIKNRRNDKIFDLLIVTFILTLIWAKFLNGYTRYAYVVPILYVVVLEITFINIEEKLKDKKDKILLYVSTGIVIFIIAIPSGYHMLLEMKNIKYYWSDVQLLKDRKTEKIHIDGAWMTLADDSKLVTMVREEGTPIYYLESRFINSPVAKERQMELKQKELYTIIDDYNKAKKIDELTLENMQIEEVIEKDKELNFLPKNDKVMICKIKYNSNNEEVRMNNLQYYN